MATRRLTLAFVLAVALTAGTPARRSPEPAEARGGSLFTCKLTPLYFVLHPDSGYIPPWVVRAFIRRNLVCV